jgi:hypothetical protein
MAGNLDYNALALEKIDGYATLGLSGTADSLAYRVAGVDRHLHSRERWFGAAAVPNAEIHVADSILTSSTTLQCDAGNDTWGSWLQVLGSSDTPAIAGMVYFDPHMALVTVIERDSSIHKIQIAGGTSGAAALASGMYSEHMFRPISADRVVPMQIQTRRQPAGTKCWIRIWVIGQNTGTMDFFFGIHEYEG